MLEALKVREDHAKLVPMINEFAELLAHPHFVRSPQSLDLRQTLMTALLDHLKLEDWYIYPRLLESEDPFVVATAQRLLDETGSLALQLVNHCGKWDAHRIEADIERYRRETRAIVDLVIKRIETENRELLPLLQKLERAA